MTSSSAVPNGNAGPLHDQAVEYAWHVVRAINELLTEPLHAAYVIGSLAMDDFAPGWSDIDVAAVTARRLTGDELQGAIEAVEATLGDCPARGLELVVYPGPVVTIRSAVLFELNLNGGPQMPLHVDTDPSEAPGHWFLLDLAIAREHALRLFGPEAAQVFSEPARAHVLTAVQRSLWWQGGSGSAPAGTVLNACRSWLYAAEGIWGSKSEAGAWARRSLSSEQQEAQPKAPATAAAIIDAALAARALRGAGPSVQEMRRFVGWVVQVVDGFSRREVRPAA